MRNSSLEDEETRGGKDETEAALRRTKENSDFRKRLHKRAHLNFSNSPAFHFPDGRSFVRTSRRAFASHARFFCRFLLPDDGCRVSKRSRKVLWHQGPSSSDVFLFFLFLSFSQMSRSSAQTVAVWTRLKTSSVHPFVFLFVFRAGLSTVPGIWHWPLSSGLVPPLFPVRSLVTMKGVSLIFFSPILRIETIFVFSLNLFISSDNWIF